MELAAGLETQFYDSDHRPMADSDAFDKRRRHVAVLKDHFLQNLKNSLATCRSAARAVVEKEKAKCARIQTRAALTKRATTVALQQCKREKGRAETTTALIQRSAQVSMQQCQQKLATATRNDVERDRHYQAWSAHFDQLQGGGRGF
jgi:hypothetical protein